MPAKKGSRDNFSKATVTALLMRVAGYCSRPECRKMTVVPDPDYPAHFTTTGRAAHIKAASKGGPRYDEAMSSQERKAAENGIWLCGDCADLIDKGKGRGYSCELIKGWKQRAEQEVSNASLLRSTANRPTWLDKLRTPHYINLPRILHLAGHEGLTPETAALFAKGIPERGSIVPQLHEVSLILRRLSIKAVDVEQLLQPSNQVVEGLVVSFYRTCRTRNGANNDPNDVHDYSFEHSPLIYSDVNDFRYIFPYDPIWLTTNTARSSVRLGHSRLAGIGIVKQLDQPRSTAICTPLTFGIPDILGMFG